MREEPIGSLFEEEGVEGEVGGGRGEEGLLFLSYVLLRGGEGRQVG